jgi:hypothetical protein
MASQMEVESFLSVLLSAYPRFEPKDPDGFLDLWSRKFGEYPAQVLTRAADQWIDSGKEFFPNLPEIKQLVDAVNQTGNLDEGAVYWEAMSFYNAALAGRVKEYPTEDRRYKRFFLAKEI